MVGQDNPVNENQQSQVESINEDQWCFAWFAPRHADIGADRAALLRGAKWAPGDVITVSFLDDDHGLQDRVRDVARQWTAPGLANLTLDFRRHANPARPTLIRISFREEGAWSVIGTTCRQITNSNQPTMNFGTLNAASSSEAIERVVLHEFGHALGLIHEHQNPDPAHPIRWNRQQVYAELSAHWTPEQIEFNIFQAFDSNATNFTTRDLESIMMYPIPRRWTTNGFSTGWNRTLSATDKRFIHDQYP